MENHNSSPFKNENGSPVDHNLDKGFGEKAEAPSKVFLGKTKDGAEVYDRIDSHFHSEGGLTPELLAEAIGAINSKGRPFIKEKIDFDHIIGAQTCVETGPEDEIVMVYRKGRSGQTPMVKNRDAEPCNSIIAILRKDFSIRDKDAYEMATSYIGSGSPREPWDPGISTDKELQQSTDFWNSHALLYDDSLIDWERTKAFEFMSEPTKRAELIRQRTIYAGLFVDPVDLYQKQPSTLEKRIKNPHVTTAFKPGLDQLHLEQIGSVARIFAIGYGNDGENEGLLVRVEADNPEIQAACDNLETPHITLSISKKGQAVNTAFLDFAPLETPFEITGRYGLFSQGKPRTNPAELSNS